MVSSINNNISKTGINPFKIELEVDLHLMNEDFK